MTTRQPRLTRWLFWLPAIGLVMWALAGCAATTGSGPNTLPTPVVAPSPTPSGAIAAAQTRIIQAELEKVAIDPGSLGVPSEMVVDEVSQVNFQLRPKLAAALANEIARSPNPIPGGPVAIIQAKLQADEKDFAVRPIRAEDQTELGDAPLMWSWQVRPLRSGDRPLFLTLTITVSAPDIKPVIKQYETIEKKIKVTSDYASDVKEFLKSYWQWMVTVIVIPLLAAGGAWWKRRTGAVGDGSPRRKGARKAKGAPRTASGRRPKPN